MEKYVRAKRYGEIVAYVRMPSSGAVDSPATTAGGVFCPASIFKHT